jgi:hypothetical protein
VRAVITPQPLTSDPAREQHIRSSQASRGYRDIEMAPNGPNGGIE